jgi:N-acetylmuramoyl-L-alanine amidase CwlA
MVPKGITIHWWGDPAHRPTFDGIVNVLLERGRQQSASVHFVAEAGRVACLVSPTVNSWGNGDGAVGWGNLNTITIECNPRCTAADRETVAELIAFLRRTYNVNPLPLFPHKRWTNTQCPGVWEQWLPWLDKRANEINANGGTAPVVAPAPAPKPVVKPAPPASGSTTIQRSTQEIHWNVEKGDTLGKIAAYYYGDGSNSNVQKIAAYNGIKNVNSLSVGQKVWIPGPMAWTIEAPDTVASICDYYGIVWQWLAARNPKQVWGPNTELYIGNVLKIM